MELGKFVVWLEAAVWHKETQWLNGTVDSFIKEKVKLWKELKKDGSKETYLDTKKALHAVYSEMWNTSFTKSNPPMTEIVFSKLQRNLKMRIKASLLKRTSLIVTRLKPTIT